MPYRLAEHTADVIIEAEGDCCARAFEDAAAGLYAVIIRDGAVQPVEWRAITVEGETLEDLLARWLEELNFLTETEGLVFSAFQVEQLQPPRLSGRAGGERFDASRHQAGLVVKGITRHLLQVQEQPGGCRLTVTLDV
jgi:SHS2 domain-containing protein